MKEICSTMSTRFFTLTVLSIRYCNKQVMQSFKFPFISSHYSDLITHISQANQHLRFALFFTLIRIYLITVRNEVIFSQAYVKNSVRGGAGGVYLSACWDTPPWADTLG